MFSIRHLFATFWRRILIEYGLWLSFFIHNAMYSHVVQNKYSIWMGKKWKCVTRSSQWKKNKIKSEYHRALQTLSYGMWTRTELICTLIWFATNVLKPISVHILGKCHNKRYHVGRIKTIQHEIVVFEVSSLIYFLLCGFSRDPNFRFFLVRVYI